MKFHKMLLYTCIAYVLIILSIVVDNHYNKLPKIEYDSQEETILTINNRCNSPVTFRYVDPFNKTDNVLLNGGESYNITTDNLLESSVLNIEDCAADICEPNLIKDYLGSWGIIV